MQGCLLIVSILLLLLAFPSHGESWQQYYQRSEQVKAQDQAFIAAELDQHGLAKATSPAATRRFGFDIHQPLAWYQTAEGQAVADAIVSLQTPSGGWSKRTDMSQLRQPGQQFGVETGYIPTFDNDATTTQLRVLARAYSATGNSVYAEAFYRGIQLIETAQYPHGGWPQNYPLTGGYHDHITLNDEVTSAILSLLWDSMQAEEDFSFISKEVQQRLQAVFDKGLAMVLQLQVRSQLTATEQGPTIWAAQYHHRTLEPAAARAYEMPALASAESATLLDFLLSLPKPSPQLQQSIHAAAQWFKQHAIYHQHWHRTERVLLAKPGAGPIWPRFAEIGSNRPIFGDRDGSIYYDVHQVSLERRQGYGWYTDQPAHSLQLYEQWRRQWPEPSAGPAVLD